MLIGRDGECAAIDDLLGRAKAGEGRSLVLRGAAGVGKSSMLAYASERAEGIRVLSVTGIESEAELAFAGLQQLCAPLLGQLRGLPGPQRDALQAAFGLSSDAPPDRFLVGLGVLTLAAGHAASQPVLLLADDTQWIDEASTGVLAFVARRLQHEPVAMLFAARSAAPLPALAGLPELVLDGLPDAQARALLAAFVPGRLDDRVLDRILAEAAGNPLALLEFSHEVTEASDLAGGFAISSTLARPLAERVQDRYLGRVRALPAAAQRMLLLAAAEPLGDPQLLERAAISLGQAVADLGPAEVADLVRLGAQVAFRHPLIRSAIYRSAPAAGRQAAHRALAAATDPELDPDHFAWHRAQATFGPDEAVAVGLELAADRALSRGGPAAAAAFLERAAALSADPGRRARRTLAAAEAKYDAGRPDEAAALLRAARSGPLGELRQAQAERLEGRLVTATSRSGQASAVLARAATRLEPLDVPLARRTYLDAIMASMLIDPDSGQPGWLEAARAAATAPRSADPARPDDLLLDGLALQASGGYATGVPTLRRAIAAFLAEGPRTGVSVGVLWLACRTAMNLWQDEDWYQLGDRLVATARSAGTLIDVPAALNALTAAVVLGGDLAMAETLIDQADAANAIIGTPPRVLGRLAVTAWQGKSARGAYPDGWPPSGRAAPAIELYSTAVRCNGLGQYDAALAAAQAGSEHADRLGYALWALPELNEAAARCGRPDLAADAARRLERTTSACRTDWGLGMQARARALAGAGAAADDAYREAIERLGRTRVSAYLARSHLVYGEWLRREGRRVDARIQLRSARELLAGMGADGFARRAERELAATGERIRRRAGGLAAELTPQEAQVARLAAEGQSNPEIAAQLFLSPRTVEYHLHKVFTKLDITARGQLARALSGRP
jgi:DNA-binding CsgD family transcriptional regulator